MMSYLSEIRSMGLIMVGNVSVATLDLRYERQELVHIDWKGLKELLLVKDLHYQRQYLQKRSP